LGEAIKIKENVYKCFKRQTAKKKASPIFETEMKTGSDKNCLSKPLEKDRQLTHAKTEHACLNVVVGRKTATTTQTAQCQSKELTVNSKAQKPTKGKTLLIIYFFNI
jgi:hypothetical protein